MKLTKEETYNYWLNTPLFGEKRLPKNAMDFGDLATIGKCMKRKNLSFTELGDRDFGIFLGHHNDIWVVAIVDLYNNLVEGEGFPTLEELKDVWQLD